MVDNAVFTSSPAFVETDGMNTNFCKHNIFSIIKITTNLIVIINTIIIMSDVLMSMTLCHHQILS